MSKLYNITNVLQRGTLRLFSDWKVSGAENVPPVGPLVIVSNHLSNFDPSLLSCSLPRRLNYLAKDGIFRAVTPRRKVVSEAVRRVPDRQGRG